MTWVASNWKSLLLFAGVVFTIVQSAFVVEQTEQALVMQFGKVVSRRVLGPGLHFKIPLVQSAIFFERRLLGFCSESREAITSDQKRIIVDGCFKYTIENPLAFYQSVRNEYNLADRLSPLIESRAREVIANVTLNCFIGECREKSTSQIKNSLSQTEQEFGIKLVDVRLRNIGLPRENLASLYLRMVAERNQEAKDTRSTGEQEKTTIASTARMEASNIVSDSTLQAADMIATADANVGKIFSEAFSGPSAKCFSYIRFMNSYTEALKSNTAMLINVEENPYFNFLAKETGQNASK